MASNQICICSTGSMRSAAQKIRLFSGPGTRRWPRFDISEVPAIEAVSLNTGSRIKAINISQGGALLQIKERAALRAKIPIHLATAAGAIHLNGFVLRSFITHPKGIPLYHVAVAFDRPLQIFNESAKSAADVSRTSPVESAQSAASSLSGSDQAPQSIQDESSAIISAFLAIDFCIDTDAAEDEMLRLNDW